MEKDYGRYVHFYLSQIDSVNGDYLSAYSHLQDYLSESQTVQEQSRADELSELEIKFGIEKTQQALEVRGQWLIVVAVISVLLVVLSIALYYTFLSIRAKKKRIETLMRELHHRVKNNLQVISSLLGLQSMRLKDAVAKKAVSEGKGRIHAMSLIHQKLYQNDHLTSLDIADYLKNLVNELAMAYGFQNKAKLIVNVPKRQMDADTSLPIGLIVNELVSNAFKYAFEGIESPKLELKLVQAPDNEFMLIVADNGVGLPESIEIESADSFGLKLVKLLTRQLKGKLEVNNQKGVTYCIKFKEVS